MNERLTLSLLYSPRRLSSSRSAPRPSLSQNWSYRKIPLGWYRMRELGSADGEEGWELFPRPPPIPLQVWWLLSSRGTRSSSPHWLLLAPQHFLPHDPETSRQTLEKLWELATGMETARRAGSRSHIPQHHWRGLLLPRRRNSPIPFPPKTSGWEAASHSTAPQPHKE